MGGWEGRGTDLGGVVLGLTAGLEGEGGGGCCREGDEEGGADHGDGGGRGLGVGERVLMLESVQTFGEIQTDLYTQTTCPLSPGCRPCPIYLATRCATDWCASPESISTTTTTSSATWFMWHATVSYSSKDRLWQLTLAKLADRRHRVRCRACPTSRRCTKSQSAAQRNSAQGWFQGIVTADEPERGAFAGLVRPRTIQPSYSGRLSPGCI